MATNFLMYCTCNANEMALAVGVPCVSCAAGLGRMCIWSGKGAGSGLLVAWAIGF